MHLSPPSKAARAAGAGAAHQAPRGSALAAARDALCAASARAIMALLAVAGISFIVNVWHARAFRAANVWRYYDVLFDSDPNTRIFALTEAMPVADALHMHLPASVHPLLPYVASPFIILGAELWAALAGLDGAAKVYARDTLAMLVSPLAMSGTIVLFGLSLIWLRLPAMTAVIGAALLGAAFSTQIFGAIPEHYPLGALANAALLAWLAYWLRDARPLSRPGYLAWAALATLAAGVTLTHVSVAALALLAVESSRHGLVRGVSRAALWSLAIVVFVTALGQAAVYLHEMFRYSLGRHPMAAVTAFIAFDISTIAGRLWMFATDTLQAIIAIGIERRPPLHWWAANDNDIIRTLAASNWPVWAYAPLAAMLALLATGIWRGLTTASGPLRSFTLVALGIILFNVVMHISFGVILFLYAQHWLAALVFLLVLNLPGDTPTRTARLVRVAALAAVVVIAGWNIGAVGQTAAMAKQITADHKARQKP